MARDTSYLQPWDDREMTDRLTQLVLSLPRERLSDLRPDPVPGAYLQFVSTDRPEVVDLLGPELSRAELPVYCGLGRRSLKQRLARYRRSLEGVDAFDESDILVTLIPCETAASAAFCEAASLATWDPVFSRLGGWGSAPPGSNRRQRISQIDALWPKVWSSDPSPVATARARLAIVEYLADLDPTGPRWPAVLPTPDARAAA